MTNLINSIRGTFDADADHVLNDYTESMAKALMNIDAELGQRLRTVLSEDLDKTYTGREIVLAIADAYRVLGEDEQAYLTNNMVTSLDNLKSA